MRGPPGQFWLRRGKGNCTFSISLSFSADHHRILTKWVRGELWVWLSLNAGGGENLGRSWCGGGSHSGLEIRFVRSVIVMQRSLETWVCKELS